MKQLSFSRLMRLIKNDALRVARPLAYGTIVLLVVTVLIYVATSSPRSTTPLANEVLLGFSLLGGGLLFTSLSFQDMHHPLGRYHYLMLPCSNIERFLSRYLLTGPLFILYAIVTTSAIDWVGNRATDYWLHTTEPSFSPLTDASQIFIRIYLVAHIAMLIGAICFRTHALLRTALALLFVAVSIVVAAYVAARIFYWNSFSWTEFHAVKSLHLQLLPLFSASWMNYAVIIGFSLWMLYVAYRCLKAHEVQDGL